MNRMLFVGVFTITYTYNHGHVIHCKSYLCSNLPARQINDTRSWLFSQFMNEIMAQVRNIIPSNTCTA